MSKAALDLSGAGLKNPILLKLTLYSWVITFEMGINRNGYSKGGMEEGGRWHRIDFKLNQ